MTQKTKKSVRIEMDEDEHRRLKSLAALKGMHLKDATSEAVKQWMERQEAKTGR